MLTRRWSCDSLATHVKINGVSTANATVNNIYLVHVQWNSLLITNGFIPGTNTLDFVVTRVPYGSAPLPTGMQVQLVVSNLPPSLLPPIADATATPPLVISPNGSSATVVLDGSRSFSPDEVPLQYAWYETGQAGPLATGVVAVTVLPVGAHTIILVVNDGAFSDTNAIAVEVITTAEAVERLIAAVSADVSRSRPLLATLDAAAASIQRGDSIPAINQLLAFQNKVCAQLAPLDATLANTLLHSAQAIIAALSAGNTDPSGRVHGVITGLTPQPSGHAGLRFSAQSGQVFLIQASTNLVDWQLVGAATDRGDGWFEWQDPAAPNFQNRFYRVISPGDLINLPSTPSLPQ
jgi:hypothetical protein